MISEDGHRIAFRFAPQQPARPCIFEYIYFSRPDSIVERPLASTTCASAWARELAREVAGRRRRGRAGAGFRRAGGARLRPGMRHPLRARHHPQPLCRPHLHPADAVGPRARRAAEALRQPRRRSTGKRIVLVDDCHRARHHLGEDRADDARGRRQGSAFPHRQPADHPSRFLRHRHAGAATSCSPPRTTLEEMRALHRRRLARLPVGRRHLPRHGRGGPQPGRGRNSPTIASPATIRRRSTDPRRRPRSLRCQLVAVLAEAD